MAQSSRLLNYNESYSIGGFQKTKIYTELNTNLKLDDRIYIVGGNFDNYSLGLGALPPNPYAEFAMGYRILAIDLSENWIVIDRDYDGIDVLASPSDEAFVSRGYFKRGQFNNGSFNDGIFGDSLAPNECLFNNKKDLLGNYEPNAYVTHCVWIDGIWHDGDWFSKTDSFEGEFKSIKAYLNDSNTVTIDELTNSDSNNYKYGYNIWVDGTWEKGHWRNGTWEAGLWLDGEWDYGIFKSGIWTTGLKHAGVHTSINGRTNWLDGIHENGEMRDCFWETGQWENGNWKGANNFKILSINTPVTAPYDTSGIHVAIKLSDLEYLPIFQIGDEVTLSYINVSGSFDNIWNMYSNIIQDITINNEIIILGSIPSSLDLSIAKISNSRWRHGIWENGNWDSGYRRAGFEIDTTTIDDTIINQVIVELIDPPSWTGTAVFPDYGIQIGDIILLTNLTDSVSNESEDYPLTISNIVIGSPTVVTLTGAPASWQNDISVKESAEGSYLDNTDWQDGNFNSGIWENGFVKKIKVYSLLNNNINDNFTHWRQGQWSLSRYTSTSNVHSHWYRGTWKKGLFKNGEWHNGIWLNGTWDNFYLEVPPSSFSNYSAYWRNGIWKNGTWIIGQWDNGTWLDGQWLDALIPSTDLGVQFRYYYVEVIDTIQYLRFRFNSLSPFSVTPAVGDFITINNTTSLLFVPVALTDSFANPVTGTTYEIQTITYDIPNGWTYITVESPQNYFFFLQLDFLGDVDIVQSSKNIFKNGEFLGGTWDNGVFENGLFQNAVYWDNGKFYSGLFDSSTWNNGNFYNGVLQNSTWNDGKFYLGQFLGNTWNDGIFYNGLIQNTTWNLGTFEGGLMFTCTINGGNFNGGEAKNSTMNNGSLNDGHLFKNSVMNAGDLNGAIFDSSIKNGGDVLDGIIKGLSIHNGGNFFGGEWLEGTFNGGVWDTDKFEGNALSYTAPGGGTTTVRLFKTNGVELIQNGNFSSAFTNWVADPQWTPVANTAQCSITPALSGTYNYNLTQNNAINYTLFDLLFGGGYKIKFNVVSNTHPFLGGIVVPPKILLFIEIGPYIIQVPTTSVGVKEIFYTPPAVGLYNFRVRAQFNGATAFVAHTIVIDNISVEKITSSTAGFTIGDEVWTSGIGYKFNIPDPLVELKQKGLVSGVTNGVLSMTFNGDLIIDKLNPTQELMYVAKGIWRSGALFDGTMSGMIFKTGNITHPTMTECLIESATQQYLVENTLTNPGLNLFSVTGWTGSSSWAINSGNAICTPTVTTAIQAIQLGILTNLSWYVVTITVSSNANYLEDYVSILLGANEFFLGSAKAGKTYKILGQADGTDFIMQVKSKQLSLTQSSVKVSGLKIEKVNIAELYLSTWVNGTANGIHFGNNSQWLDGTLTTGSFFDSTWEEGTSEFAKFYNSTWKAGIWNDGEWNGVESYDGIWEYGTWNDGMFYNGEWLCGAWNRGIWNYGLFRDGAMEGETKFYSGAIQYGRITERRYPTRIFNTANLNLDAVGSTLLLKASTGETFTSLTASNSYSTYKYPSSTYTPANWGGVSQPSYVTTFRAAGNWSLDEREIILRDVFDYYLNSLGIYSDIWDVDFVTSNIFTTADLSGDGMITSANTQTGVNLRITKKRYDEYSLIKSGTSTGFTTTGSSQSGRNDIQWLGGTYIGILTGAKITGTTTFRAAAIFGGNIELRFNENLSAQFVGATTVYLYGTGLFNNDINTYPYSNKDNFYTIVSTSWTGVYFRIRTSTPAIGVTPGGTATTPIELWKNIHNTEPTANYTNSYSLEKYGRYLALRFNGTALSANIKGLDVMFTGLSASVTAHIKNNKIYKIKSIVDPVGPTYLIVLDKKVGTFSTINVTAPPAINVTVKWFDLPDDINEFCLGGGGPGTLPPAPPGPVGPA